MYGMQKACAVEEPIPAADDDRTVGGFHGIVGCSAALQGVLRLVESVARTDAAVLIRGRSVATTSGS